MCSAFFFVTILDGDPLPSSGVRLYSAAAATTVIVDFLRLIILVKS